MPRDSQESPLGQGLVAVIERLRSPPLLFALGVLVVLGLAASVSVEALSVLRYPALALAAIGLAAWLAPQFLRRGGGGGTSSVKLQVKKVGATGRVSGIENLP